MDQGWWGKNLTPTVIQHFLLHPPPVEVIKLIISIAASNIDNAITTNDVSRAFFYAPMQAGQNIYVKLPAEDINPGEECICAKLNFSLYGTRQAAANWQK